MTPSGTRRIASLMPADATRALARFLRRGAIVALMAAAASGLAAYVLTQRAPSIYRAEVGLITSQSASSLEGLQVITPPAVDPDVYRSALLEGGLVADALARIGEAAPTSRELRAFLRSLDVRVDASPRSSMIWISVRDASPGFAANAANAIAEELIAWDRDRARRAVDRSLDALQRSIADLEQQLVAAENAGDTERAASLRALMEQRSAEYDAAVDATSSALVVGLLEPLRFVEPPDRPVGPSPLTITLIAVALGLVLGYGLHLLRSVFGRRVNDRDELVDATGLPVLAEFPRRARRSIRLSAEAAGFFRAKIDVATRELAPKIFLVTSALSPSDRTGVAISLAESFARSGQATLLVDADLRDGGVTASLDLTPNVALPFERLLAEPGSPFEPVTIALGSQRSFDLVPSFGTSSRLPVDLLGHGFAKQLAVWKDAYDVIILDAPPVVPYADTVAMAPFCSGVVLSVSASGSRLDDVEAAQSVLASPEITLLGIALTDVDPRRLPAESRNGRQASRGGAAPSEATRAGRAPRRDR